MEHPNPCRLAISHSTPFDYLFLLCSYVCILSPLPLLLLLLLCMFGLLVIIVIVVVIVVYVCVFCPLSQNKVFHVE